jgi:hypothetical protein
MSTLREPFMAAAQASLAALYPERIILRGLQDPAQLGDARLRQGVYALIATGTKDWATHRGREGQDGTLGFVIVGYGRVDDSATPQALEQAEAVMESELLAWCQAIKPTPLDAVYPRDVLYSAGFDHPYTWIVLNLEGLYI